METIDVDVKGQDCPVPLMELKRALAQAQPGQLVRVEFTCPEATVNIPSYCEDAGVQIVSFEKPDKHAWTITVRAR